MEHASPEDYLDHSEVESGEEDQDVKLELSQTSPSQGSHSAAKAQAVKNSGHLQKRRRVTRACDECRRKKIKCDGKQPCTHCTVYSYDCTYDQPSNRRRNPAPQYVENLEHRVHRAEALLHILIPNLDLNDPGIDLAVAQGWIPGAPGKGEPPAARPQPPPIVTSAPQAAAIPLVDAKSSDIGSNGIKVPDTNLESMVRAVAQMDIDEQGNWDYHGHSSGLSFMRRMREQLGDLMGPDSPATPFVKSRPRSQVIDSPRSGVDSPSNDPSSPGSELPPKEDARQFCSNAVEDAAALLRFVHKPTFWRSFERIYSVPAEHWGNDEHRFLPLLYSAMALGCLFGKDEHSSLNQMGYENAIQQGFAYFKAARQMMDIADCRDLMSVQAVIFMILFMQSSAKLSQCYAYVGVALRSALRMGLHRSYAGNFDPIENETRKRVFWVIRKMDIYVGAMLGLPQTLSDDDIDQEFPAEVDDEYITHEGIKPMPEGTISQMVAFNAHTRIVGLLQKIVRNVYPIKVQSAPDKSYTVPFSAIREIEADLRHWLDTLPSILNPSEHSERFTRLQQLLRLAYAHAQVLLYRPFLHFTAAEKHSKPIDDRAIACAFSYINVSRNIIKLTANMKSKGLLNGSFWFIMYTTFFSILSLVYYAAENPENETTQSVMHDAIEGKKILASLASRSMAADRCTATLDVIFQRLPVWMREGRHNPTTSRKRHRSPPAHQYSHTHAAQSHPDVSTLRDPVPGVQRASTFPRHGGPQLAESAGFDTASSWNQSGTSSFGPQTPATNGGMDQRGFMGFNNPNTMPISNPGMQQYSVPNFANSAIHDMSSMMFPAGGDEPFLYPNQPLTTFENNQQYAKSNADTFMNAHNFNATGAGSMVGGNSANAGMLGAGSSSGRDDNIEAQFFALPPYIEQAVRQQQQHQGSPFTQDRVGYGNVQGMQNMSQLPNGVSNGIHQQQSWPPQRQQGQQQQPYGGQQQQQQDPLGNISIQDLFGGAEWNPMMPGFPQP